MSLLEKSGETSNQHTENFNPMYSWWFLSPDYIGIETVLKHCQPQIQREQMLVTIQERI